MTFCTALVLPTLNAESHWQTWLDSFQKQTFKPDKVLVVDSSSSDQTPNLARQAGFQVHTIDRADFDHGGTRQLAANLLGDADVLIYMTQDAILATPDSLHQLVTAFNNPKIGVAYGRQLPNADAKPIGTHARLFNYSSQSEVRSKADIPVKRFKTAFCSDSFAAYRRSALEAVGGFPLKVVFGEDVVTTTKLLLNDWSVAYVAEAQVYHSHDYTILQEFKRFFDIGTFHSHNPWMLEVLGKAEGEGLKFLKSELSYLWKHAPMYLPSALVRTFVKYVAYKLGRFSPNLPTSLNSALTLNQGYYQNQLKSK